jgi:hypothetical protein
VNEITGFAGITGHRFDDGAFGYRDRRLRLQFDRR